MEYRVKKKDAIQNFDSILVSSLIMIIRGDYVNGKEILSMFTRKESQYVNQEDIMIKNRSACLELVPCLLLWTLLLS